MRLHGIILLWGFTAILGKLIELPSLQIVFIRSGIAAIVLAMLLGWRTLRETSLAGRFLANGALIGLHWVTFFASAKVANVSVCMVGMATISLWTALLEPVMIRHRKIRWDELIFGSLIVVGVCWIFRGEAFQSDPSLPAGLGLALISAICAAVFSIFNGMFVQQQSNYRVIVAFEMAGACAFCGAAIIVSVVLGLASWTEYRLPGALDWLWLVLLAVVCTVYAYSQYVELLKRLSVFTINFANNMEPLYGMLLGALIFRDDRQLDASFYTGFVFIGLIVAVQPLIGSSRVRRRFGKADLSAEA